MVKKIIIAIVTLVILWGACYFWWDYIAGENLKKEAQVKENIKTCTQEILARASLQKEANNAVIAKESIDKLNELTKNPFSPKKPAFVWGESCMGCVEVELDTQTKNIILTAYNKEGKLLARTLVNPPSYVTFERKANEAQ